MGQLIQFPKAEEPPPPETEVETFEEWGPREVAHLTAVVVDVEEALDDEPLFWQRVNELRFYLDGLATVRDHGG